MKINSRLKPALVVLCALAVFTLPLVAGGSSYSRFGVGDLMRYGGSRIDAMGGAGIALTGDGFLNLLNPAGISKISFTRFAGGFEYASFNSTDATSSGRYARGAFKGVAFGIPVSRNDGVTLLLEASPYSNVNYATQVRDSILQQDFYGTGGLSLLAIGTSYSPAKYLTFGLRMNYVYGRIRQVGDFTFSDPTFLNSEIERSDFYSGFNATFGALYDSIGTSLNSKALEPLAVGFVFSTPSTFSVERQSILTTSQSTDTTAIASGNADLPVAYGLGLSYLFSGRYYVTGDVQYQKWSNARLFGTTMPDIRNSIRYGIGFESLPQRDTDSFWKRIAYRLGFSYSQTSYSLNATGINEMYATGGLAIPIGPDARLDIGLQVGTRGTTVNGLQRDTIMKLSLSLSASEVWFMNIEDE
ncbi:MAG TPA: hypothetical protein DEP53_18665 [Bacteroidetes bacterium]|nr:MAG: hypothetical protein A2X66_01130 [Ignavibacteria bacterium GWA2_54_16]HCA81757.1 hypothetical protein [Bacteroidota bacterium]